MQVPGDTFSSMPDECGGRASKFAEAIRDKQMRLAWNLLSRESKGIWQGIWLTRKGYDPIDVYGAVSNASSGLFQTMLDDLQSDLLEYWKQENLAILGVAPTKYLDDQRALVRLVIGVTEPVVVEKETAVPTIVIPMIFDDGQWKVHIVGYGWLL